MKVKLSEVKEKSFDPFDVTITIESEEELCNLYLRMNLNSSVVNESNQVLKHKANGSDWALFKVLKQKVEELNLILKQYV